MANFKINTTISAPTDIDIPLVRADHHHASNIFRFFFEVFLTLFAVLLGHVLSIKDPELIHFIALGVTGGAATIFISIYAYFCAQAKKGITNRSSRS